MAVLGNTLVNGSLQANEIKAVGVSGSNALFVSGNALIHGDLEIQGELVYVGTKDIRVEDKLIEIAYKSGSETTPQEADGAGIIIGNETNPVVSITYDNASGKVKVNKTIAGTIDSASVASVANKVQNALVFGEGLTATKTSYNGSEAVSIKVNASGLQMDSAKHADSASKVDHTLTIKGDGVPAEVVYDGSAAKTVNLNLSAYATVAGLNQHVSASTVKIDSVYASASAWHTADSASALAAHNAAKAAQGTADGAVASINEVKATYLTTASHLAYSQSISQSVSALQAQLGDTSTTVTEKITAAINNLDVAVTGSAGYHITSISETNGKISAAVAKDDSYTIKKQAAADEGYLATYQLHKNGVAVGDKINIAKDLVVESGDVKTVTTPDQPVAGYKVGDKYIDLVLAHSGNHIYILVSDLVDKYDGKNIVLSSTYLKATTYTDPAVGDTVDVAVGKLAKGIDVSRAEASQSLVNAKAYSKNAVDWVATNGTNVVASASVATAAKAEAARLTAKSGSWDTAASIVETNKAAWSAAQANAIASASSSLAAYSASQATTNSSLNTKITNVYASASNWHTADSQSIATNAAAIKTLASHTGSYMNLDGSNSNIAETGLSFSAGAAVIKYNATAQAFEFIFN